ncbi:hypothetical protein [Xenorhabdus griffiniae]|uniref:Phage coat protein n=1 Tax=Xenorhabdus griffiniae TaxID=351672 RepID=A0ABY9XCJ7_9GAMM|nr:hypothetical protein [Xenorhabdus griffiniae]MBD1226405.1 hypothetical protein [Xenorhabdus griffiniae]MBE8588724.1 hypothetical protein [Xenorhabdus griffiniae]WMV70631.1 hypothetical protein QL128_10310 [Xenorhabdus griffiniae]WNH00308.1 hypothetical protein QL112_010315 [Xenorhabdus griffiniae]
MGVLSSCKFFSKKATLVVALAVTPVFAFADEAINKTGVVDYSALTSNINLSGDVLPVIMSIGASIITLLAGIAGVKWAMKMVRGA